MKALRVVGSLMISAIANHPCQVAQSPSHIAITLSHKRHVMTKGRFVEGGRRPKRRRTAKKTAQVGSWAEFLEVEPEMLGCRHDGHVTESKQATAIHKV